MDDDRPSAAEISRSVRAAERSAVAIAAECLARADAYDAMTGRRLWRFYLGYCEAGFRTERTNVVQLSLTKS